MTNSQQLREQMWDLVYGLLDTGESQDVIARIKSDPQAARLYAEVRLQADLVGYAARVEDPSFVLNVDASAEKPAPAKREKSAASAIKQLPAARRPTAGERGGAWMAIAAATALAMLLAVGQFWPRADDRMLATAYIVTEIEAPRSIPGGLANTVAFHTTTLGGEGQPATVDFAVRGREARSCFASRSKRTTAPRLRRDSGSGSARRAAGSV
jgi:anti-sigma factor RsiW